MKLEEKFPGIEVLKLPMDPPDDFSDFENWHDLEKAEFYAAVAKTALENGYERKWISDLLNIDPSTLAKYRRLCILPPIAKKALVDGVLKRHPLMELFEGTYLRKKMFKSLPSEILRAAKEYRECVSRLPNGQALESEMNPMKPIYQNITTEKPPKEIFNDEKSTEDERNRAFLSLHPAERARLCCETSDSFGGARMYSDNKTGKRFGISIDLVRRYRGAHKLFGKNPELAEKLKKGDPHTEVFRALNKAKKANKSTPLTTNGLIADDDLPDIPQDVIARLRQIGGIK
ncbi:hypothetical protein KJ742_04525 [Patescibacteria group bacterium]|nr:hypothetical protein [Patescibacteria group bacterium]MBU1683184.1 hypothetical protein [Patescibacteria group bacterium]MBU1934742.1 hypothetical protein [Patescibacteria group bacterium]